MLLVRLARPADELVETLDGTMVFADVSGFTRLSERLALRQIIEAEMPLPVKAGVNRRPVFRGEVVRTAGAGTPSWATPSTWPRA
jgi:hypothetical protein